MRIIEVKIYNFDELSDEAKETALDALRYTQTDFDWWQYTYEDAERVSLKLETFDLDRNRHAKGEFITSAPECAESIIKEHGESCETYKTAQNYLKQLRFIGESCDAEDYSDEREEWEAKREEIDEAFLHELLEDYSILLQRESEYLTSDEAVKEMIEANSYEFTEDGRLA